MVKIATEEATLEAAMSISLSRFGDGELRCAVGGTCLGQSEKNKKLMNELQTILRVGASGLLVCLPNYAAPGPNKSNWQRYAAPEYLRLFGKQTFGSAFITRPDSAPWIDKPKYWDRVEDLWRGKNITLVYGSRKSLTEDMLTGPGCANTILPITVPETEAYSIIDEVEEKVGQTSNTVILCCGVMATVLAWRLARKGIHALDLGHIGMFMRHAGAYHYQPDDLTTLRYRSQLQRMHNTTKWGGDGKKHADAVVAYADRLGARSILDYGCGRGTLRKTLDPRKVMEYDPGVQGKAAMPKPADLVVCTDVLEHVERDKVDVVLKHLYCLTGLGAYVTIATRVANTVLPNGKNAHLTVESSEWWINRIAAAGFKTLDMETKQDHEVKLWLAK